MVRGVLVLAIGVFSIVASAAEPDIELTVSVKAPLSEVWKAWTTTEGITGFFAPEAQIEARPDGDFHVFIDPYAEPGMKGADDMRVLAIENEKLLSFTWNAPPSLAEARKQRTVVILRFAPEESSTKLTLNHVGWGEGGEWPKARAYFARAWPFVLKNLQQRFETAQRKDWTEWRDNLKKLHANDGAKKTSPN